MKHLLTVYVNSYTFFRMMTISRQTNSYAQLIEQIEPLQSSLLRHGIYREVKDLPSMQAFMEVHVFAVWDFMTLVKSLQRHLTCISLPWLPPSDIHSARLINDIVLAEETDEVAPGFYISHFDLYLKAMREVGANTEPIQTFIRLLREGVPVEQALANLPIHASTKSFVLNTLNSAAGSVPEVAAAFLLGRETVIPSMFQRILDQLEQAQGLSCESFRLYLDRHIHLDEESHAPMGQKLLQNVCGNDPVKWQQAQKAAQRALIARHHLWDGAIEAIRKPEVANSPDKRSILAQMARLNIGQMNDRYNSLLPLENHQSLNLPTQAATEAQSESNASLASFPQKDSLLPSRKLDLLPLVFGVITVLFVGGLFVYGNSRRQDVNEEVTQLKINESMVDLGDLQEQVQLLLNGDKANHAMMLF